MISDEHYMNLALALADKAMGRTSPNPMVGAVIVKNGEIVGQGYHKKAGTPHAEIHALQEAGGDSRGGTMYVTLEPCSHHGRTPPCSQAVIKAGLARVVVAMEDPNPLVAGRGIKQMREAGIEVEVGLKKKEAWELNEIFIKYITTRIPFILMKTAMTIDGKIAATGGDSRWVTGQAARQLVHRWRDCYDAILVGVGTVLADDPQLTSRIEDERTQNPLRIVLDSQGRIPLDAAVVNTEFAPTIVVGTEGFSANKKQALEERGVEVLVVPPKEGRPDLRYLMEAMGRREITSLLLEGGAVVNASFLKEGLVDKVAWFIAPKVIGGQGASGPVAHMGFTRMDQALGITNISVRQIETDILITGYFDYK